MNLNINYSIDCLKIITEEFDKNNIPETDFLLTTEHYWEHTEI